VAKEITDELEDWRDVDQSLPAEERGLLIGNWASIPHFLNGLRPGDGRILGFTQT